MNLDEAKAKYDRLCGYYLGKGIGFDVLAAKYALDAAVKDVALVAVEMALGNAEISKAKSGRPYIWYKSAKTLAEIERLFGKGE